MALRGPFAAVSKSQSLLLLLSTIILYQYAYCPPEHSLYLPAFHARASSYRQALGEVDTRASYRSASIGSFPIQFQLFRDSEL